MTRSLGAVVVIAISLCAACGAHRAGPPSGAVKSTSPEAFQRDLTSARDAKYVAMYRELQATREQNRDLQSRLEADEGELAQLRVRVEQLGGTMPPPPGSGSGIGSRNASDNPLAPADDGGSDVRGGAGTLSSDAQSQLVLSALRDELASERERGNRLEAELQGLRQETAAGPFESQRDAELREAQDRVRELEQALQNERRERDKLIAQYETLRSQAATASTDTAGAENAALRRQVEDLKGQQGAVLASIQRDLAASQQREAELRASLDATAVQAAEAVALRQELLDLKGQQEAQLANVQRDLAASQQRESELRAAARSGQAAADDTGESKSPVADLSAENRALQARIDEAHRQNEQLAAKLRVATRVTDLIFKMQAETAR